MITLEVAAHSAKSLLFEGDDSVDYWLGGSCFVCSYRGHGFIITAAHALAWGNEKRGEILRVELSRLRPAAWRMRALGG
jgi:hypothetical protein